MIQDLYRYASELSPKYGQIVAFQLEECVDDHGFGNNIMAFLCENCTFYYAPLKDYIEFKNDAIARELYDLCAYQDIDAIAIDSVGRIFLLRDTAIGLVEEDGFKWMTR